MRNILTLGIIVTLCVAATSCVTKQSQEVTYHPISCIVEPESEVVFEIKLDGKLVLSGKAAPDQISSHQFPAPFGDHVLSVTADNHVPWQRTISVVGGAAGSQEFWAKLEKAK